MAEACRTTSLPTWLYGGGNLLVLSSGGLPQSPIEGRHLLRSELQTLRPRAYWRSRSVSATSSGSSPSKTSSFLGSIVYFPCTDNFTSPVGQRHSIGPCAGSQFMTP